MKIILLISLLLTFLGSCDFRHVMKAESYITPYGNDSYTVTYVGRNFAATKAVVHKAANNYCQKKGKILQVKNEESVNRWRNKTVELVFKCIDKKNNVMVKDTITSSNPPAVLSVSKPVHISISDLNDHIIPKTGVVNPYAIAVVIGNRDYNKVSNIQYAINDAASVRKFLVKSYHIAGRLPCK